MIYDPQKLWELNDINVNASISHKTLPDIILLRIKWGGYLKFQGSNTDLDDFPCGLLRKGIIQPCKYLRGSDNWDTYSVRIGKEGVWKVEHQGRAVLDLSDLTNEEADKIASDFTQFCLENTRF